MSDKRISDEMELINWLVDVDERGNKVGALPLWDSGQCVLVELAPGKIPVDVRLANEEFFAAFNTGRKYTEEDDTPTDRSGRGGWLDVDGVSPPERITKFHVIHA